MKFIYSLLLMFLISAGTFANIYDRPLENDYIDQWGKLKLVGTQLASEKCEAIRLSGFIIDVFNNDTLEYITKESFRQMKVLWANMVTLGIYTQYREAPEDWSIDKVKQMIDETNEIGIYCLIYVENNENNIEECKSFFSKVSTYVEEKGYKHVMYAIKDNFTSNKLNDIANAVVPSVAENDPNAVFLIGDESLMFVTDITSDKSNVVTFSNPVCNNINLMYITNHILDYHNDIPLVLNPLPNRCNIIDYIEYLGEQVNIYGSSTSANEVSKNMISSFWGFWEEGKSMCYVFKEEKMKDFPTFDENTKELISGNISDMLNDEVFDYYNYIMFPDGPIGGCYYEFIEYILIGHDEDYYSNHTHVKYDKVMNIPTQKDSIFDFGYYGVDICGYPYSPFDTCLTKAAKYSNEGYNFRTNMCDINVFPCFGPGNGEVQDSMVCHSLGYCSNMEFSLYYIVNIETPGYYTIDALTNIETPTDLKIYIVKDHYDYYDRNSYIIRNLNDKSEYLGNISLTAVPMDSSHCTNPENPRYCWEWNQLVGEDKNSNYGVLFNRKGQFAIGIYFDTDVDVENTLGGLRFNLVDTVIPRHELYSPDYCSSTSKDEIVEKDQQSKFIISPNPIEDGSFSINGFEGLASISIFNMQENKVQTLTSIKAGEKIPVNIPSGFYILKINTDNVIEYIKIMIK